MTETGTEIIKAPELSQPGNNPLTANEIWNQVQLIQDVMSRVMKEGDHYGVIPGCGDKKCLYKSGAEKLCMTFRLVPQYSVRQTEYPNNHRDYEVRCKMYSSSGQLLGEGVGICSTMESKYRYRKADGEVTDKPVPKAYWDLRKKDSEKAQELLGGSGFSTKKVGADWFISKQGEGKVENENIADVYNTVLKMSKKRSMVDAVLQVTAASDMFTQDLEDIAENMKHAVAESVPTVTSHPIKGDPKPEIVRKEPEPGKLYAPNPPAEKLSLDTPWREVVCHVPGYGEGKKLGQMDKRSLDVLVKHWRMYPDPVTGEYDPKDQVLAAAIYQIKEERKKGGAK